MESKVNYTAVGFFVVVFSIAAFIFALWLAQLKSQKVYDTYIVYLPESVAGLSVNSQVQYNGVEVGFVSKIELNPKNLEEAKLTLQLFDGTPVTTATKARLQAQGLTGIAVIDLHCDQPTAPVLTFTKGQPYPVIPSEPSFFNSLDKAIRGISMSIQSVGDNFNKLLTDQNIKNFSQSLDNIQKISDSIAKNAKQIDSSLKHADEMLENLAIVSKSLPHTIDNFDKTLVDVRGMSLKLSDAGGNVTSAMKDGRVMVKQLSQDTLPQATDLIRKLNTIANNLESASRELKQNPGVLIRGREPAALGPGERR